MSKRSTTIGNALLDSAPIALVALCSGLYLPAVRGRFLFDDLWTIVHNPAIRSFARLPALFSGRALAEGLPDAWRPLMVVSHMVDYQLFGMHPAGYHLHTILWHAAATVALWAVCRRLLGDRWLALLCGALFAVHPLHVEAVAAINFREDAMAMALALAGVAVLLPAPRGDGVALPEDFAATWRRAVWRLPLAGLLVLCGLWAKATAAVAPAIYLAGYLVALRARSSTRAAGGADSSPVEIAASTREDASSSGQGATRPWWKDLGFALPGLGALLAGFLAFVVWRLITGGSLDPYAALGVETAASDVGRLSVWPTYAVVFVEMLGQLIVPRAMAPFYEQPLHHWGSAAGLLAVLVVLGVGAVALWAWWRGRAPIAFGLALLLVGWLPTSGIAPLPHLRADRYAYLPSAGICLVGAALLLRLRPAPLKIGASLAVLALLAAITLGQQRYWRSSLALWRHGVAVSPRSPLALGGLGRALSRRGHHAEAETYALRAVALGRGRPREGDLVFYLANIEARAGELQQALTRYPEAARLGVRFPGYLYASWGWALHLSGRTAEAEQRLREGLVRAPRLAPLYFNLARVLAHQGRRAEALRALRHALRCAPERARYRRLLRAYRRGAEGDRRSDRR